MEIRKYIIVSTQELDKIDFSKVCEDSVDTLRYSKDGLYTFVKFEGEAQQVATQVIAKSGSVNKKTTTNKLEIQLPEKINNIKVEIQGIGTIHYVVFNGTENEF